MAAVYTSNLVINTGSSFSQTFTLEGSDDSAFDLSGYTVTSQMRKWRGAATATDFTTAIPTPATQGKVLLSLTATETAALTPGRHVYDVLITQGATKELVVEGSVLIREGVTR
tara:strand:+ start:19061 stop:19399 length:339 start_codon:yes stop_codon:yes gene_type:complete